MILDTMLRVFLTESPENPNVMRRAESAFEAVMGCRPDYAEPDQHEVMSDLFRRIMSHQQ